MTVQCFRRIAGLEEPTEAQLGTIVKLERSAPEENEQPIRNNEQQGLFHLHVPAARTSATLHYHDIDLIAVHGLGGDAYRTWQHADGFSWLQDIHHVLPGIRTYAYGYDTVAAFATDPKGFGDYARHLITLVKGTRSSEHVCIVSCKIIRSRLILCRVRNAKLFSYVTEWVVCWSNRRV